MLSLPVLPLIGIGGVGKTALAQHICNHQRVKSYFEYIIWICVSDDFDVQRLTKEAIQSCTEKEPTTNNLDSLQHALSNHVNNKRLLIVLDDMWDDALKENDQCWKRFCAPFRSTQEGSAMLVTTRCSKVTEGVRTMEPIKLEGLEDDVFWNFFKSCVFGSDSSENYPELEHIGTKLKHMRVICCASADELPDSIGNWKHLRYLEIFGACPLKRIPSTFCWLYNLQLLYAKKCKLESLPSDFCKLTSLQKFESDGLPYYAGSRMYLIDAADGQGQRIVRLVKNLNQLCGHLEIVNVGALSKDHAAEAGLKNKIFLEKLKLDMRNALGSLELYTHDKNIEVLEVLQPPSSLKPFGV